MTQKENKPGIFIAYAEMWRNGITFSGRTSRRFFVLARILDLIFLTAAEGVIIFIRTILLKDDLASALTVLLCISRMLFDICILLPMYSRRLHDANKHTAKVIISRCGLIIILLFAVIVNLNSLSVSDNLIKVVIGLGGVFGIIQFISSLDCILFPGVSEGSRFGDYTSRDTCSSELSAEEQKELAEYKPKFQAQKISNPYKEQLSKTKEGEDR